MNLPRTGKSGSREEELLLTLSAGRSYLPRHDSEQTFLETRPVKLISSRWRRLGERWGWSPVPTCDPGLPVDVAGYLVDSYPQNHNYTVWQGQLVPRHKLKTRFTQLTEWYPDPLESLLDLSCSKGFFVLDSAGRGGCRRSLGIDIDARELDVCRTVGEYLDLSTTDFEMLKLDELVDRIDEFGGPFQTVLLVNSYQYLYFGSSRSPECYQDHEAIFEMIRRVCSGRVIFSNRTQLHQLQRSCRQAAESIGHEELYCESRILDAASRFFHVTQQGQLGKWPLWTLDVPGASLSAAA